LANRDASQGVHLVTAYVAGNGSPRDQEFIQKYQERFHVAPNVYGALAHDAARLLGYATRSAHAPENGKVGELLNGLTSFDSLTGPVTFGQDHYAHRAVFIVRCDEGRLHLVRRVGPDDETVRLSPPSCLSPFLWRYTLMGGTSAPTVLAGPGAANL